MMPITVTIPPLGESITQVILVKWHKKAGDVVAKDEPLCELETDKANVDVPSPAAGILTPSVEEGQAVAINQPIATIAESAGTPSVLPAAVQSVAAGTTPKSPILSPAAQRIATEAAIDPASVAGTGRGGRITKQDVALVAAAAPTGAAEMIDKLPQSPKTAAIPVPSRPATPPVSVSSASATAGGERREPMTKIRRKIAERLVAAQHAAAMLTTFNEVDLSVVQELRARYKDRFTEVYGTGLGLMPFFVRASVLALREFPRVNASIDGTDVVYHDHVHLGIAVSTERGLAVPVLRNAQLLSFAQIESEIHRLASSARDGKLAIDELSGGTFSITNGGVFGSLLSTPIINPPQSAILGMHTIQKRPVAVNDKVEIRPMMYVALSYDHRLIDGRESVSFLVRIKQYLEDPARLVLEV